MPIILVVGILLYPSLGLAQTVLPNVEARPEMGLFCWLKPGIQPEATFNFSGDDLNLNWKHTYKTPVNPLNRIYTIHGFRDKLQLQKVLASLKGTDNVELIERIPEYKFFYTPNDLKTAQWNLTTIQAEKAWDLSKGSKNIVVGLVDDGLDTAHSDLQPIVWHNLKEIPNNGKDDDGNGYVDDWFGWDMANMDNDPAVTVADNLSHGTHCAGIIGAKTDNNNGIAGIGFNIQIIPIKCGQKGQPYVYNAYEGVEYCINNGAKIISMSWGGGGYSATYQAIFDYAATKNVVCVAAAGNSSTTSIMYPAGYNNVIAVGSTAFGDKVSSFSNYGSWVDVMAPGSAIYSTLLGNTYGNKSGTSMACPLVSGLCALMLSRNPALTAAQVENCLKTGCENIDVGNSAYVGQMGAGRINAWNSIKCVKSFNASFSASKRGVCTGDTVQFGDISYPAATQWRWNFQGGTPATSNQKNPIVKYNIPGTYSIKLWVTDGKEQDSVLFNNFITVGTATVTFSGNQSIYAGDFGTIQAEFTGPGPWDLKYTDGKTIFTQNGITSTPYFILVKPNAYTIYKPVSVSVAGCAGSKFDSTIIKVSPPPLGSSDCDSGYRFQMNFGGPGTDMGLDIVSVNDSTVLVAGKTGLGYGQGDGFVASVNTGGTVNWFKVYGGSSEDGLYTIVRDPLGSIYTGGYTYSGVTGRSAVMLKLDAKGNVIWRKVYGSSAEYIYHATLSADRKYIYFTGLSIDQSFGSEDFTIYKMDTSGNIVWVKQVGESDLNRNHNMIEYNNGNDLYIIGTTGDPYPSLSAVLTKLNSSGSVQWTKKYNILSNYRMTFSDIKRWNAKEFMVYGFVGGNPTRECFLARMGTDGSVKWAKKYTFNELNPWQMEIIGNNILLSGGNNNNGEDGFILMTDSNGNVLQSRTLGTSGSEFIYGLTVTPKNEILYTGIQRRGSDDVWVGQAGCRLNSLCDGSSFSPIVTALSIRTSTVIYSDQDFNRAVSPSHGYSTQYSTTTIICKSSKSTISKPPCKLKANFTIVDKCLGDTVVFSDLSTDDQYTIATRQWFFGDGATATGVSVKHAFKKAGSYLVKLRVISKLGDFTCTDSITKLYRAVDSFRITKMPLDTTICLGDSIQLSGMSLLCANPLLKYKWTPIWINDATAALPWVSPKLTQIYTVEITDGFGNKATGFVKVTVNQNCCKSKARILISKNVCEMDTQYFRNGSTCKSNAIFQWRFQGTNVPSFSGKSPPFVIFPKPGVYKVHLKLSDACSNDSTEEIILVYPKPRAYAGKDTVLCKADSLQIGETALGRNIYQWVPTSGLNKPNLADPQAKVAGSIVYHLKVIDEFGCKNYDTIQIGYGKPPSFSLGSDTTICYGIPFSLEAPSILASSYLWSTGQTNPGIVLQKSGKYWLRISNKCGVAADTVVIKLDDCLCPIYIPNVFTPEMSQGRNDRFSITFTCPYEKMTAKIYNRWGEKLYEGSDPKNLWDGTYQGKPVPSGTYYYIVEIQSSPHYDGQSFYKSGVIYVLY